MSIYLRATSPATIIVGPFINSTDGISSMTAIEISSATIVDIYKATAKTDITTSTAGANAMAHVANGYYSLVLTSGDTSVVGPFMVTANAPSSLSVWQRYTVVPANIYDSLVSGTDSIIAVVTGVAQASALTAVKTETASTLAWILQTAQASTITGVAQASATTAIKVETASTLAWILQVAQASTVTGVAQASSLSAVKVETASSLVWIASARTAISVASASAMTNLAYASSLTAVKTDTASSLVWIASTWTAVGVASASAMTNLAYASSLSAVKMDTASSLVWIASAHTNIAAVKVDTASSLANIDRNADLFERAHSFHHTWRGNVWYVDPVNGNDSTGTGTRLLPYKTVTQAHTAATTDNHDVIFLVARDATVTMNEQVTISKNRILIRGPGRHFHWSSTSSGNVINVSGEGCELGNFRVSTFTIGTGDAISITGDRCHVHGIWCEYARSDAIMITSADWAVIENCTISGTGANAASAGIHMVGTATATENKILKCHIHDVTGDGISLSGSNLDNTHVEDSIIDGSSGWGISIASNVTDTMILRNVIVDNASGAISDSGTNTQQMNNDAWALATSLTAVKVDTASSLVWIASAHTNITALPTSGTINAQVLDVLNTDTFAEPGQGIPTSTTSLVNKIGYTYKFLRNKIDTSSSLINIYNATADTVDHKSTISDDGTTFTRGAFGSGP